MTSRKMKPDLLLSEPEDDLMSDINMTPFIDVMFVLLIILLVTLPAIHHALTLTLPQANSQAQKNQQAHVALSVRANGSLLWEGKPVDNITLSTRLRTLSQQSPQPELHVYADRAVRYEYIAQIMSAAQSNHLTKLTFVTEPDVR